MIKSLLFLLTFICLVVGQNDTEEIYIEGEYERRFYAGESNEECRVACIDSAKSNIIDNYIFNRFGNHIFSDEQRNLCINELKPLIGEIKIIDERAISRRNASIYLRLSAYINDNIFYQKVQQIIQ
tara:strand:- start:288 stop:665 length:378 start_codon:yes stop_codon:yes gene_type:complete